MHLLTLLGFGLILTFLKRYTQGSLVHSFLIIGVVVQWATLLQGFFKMRKSKVHLTLDGYVFNFSTACTNVHLFSSPSATISECLEPSAKTAV